MSKEPVSLRLHYTTPTGSLSLVCTGKFPPKQAAAIAEAAAQLATALGVEIEPPDDEVIKEREK